MANVFEVATNAPDIDRNVVTCVARHGQGTGSGRQRNSFAVVERQAPIPHGPEIHRSFIRTCGAFFPTNGRRKWIVVVIVESLKATIVSIRKTFTQITL